MTDFPAAFGTDRPAPRVSPSLWPDANAARSRAERIARAMDFAAGVVFGASAMLCLTLILLCALAPEALATLVGLPPVPPMELR